MSFITINEPLKEALSDLRKVKEIIRKYQEQERNIRDFIMNKMGDATYLLDVDGEKLATQKIVKTMMFDTKRFKEERMMEYAEYCVEKEHKKLFVGRSE